MQLILGHALDMEDRAIVELEKEKRRLVGLVDRGDLELVDDLVLVFDGAFARALAVFGETAV